MGDDLIWVEVTEATPSSGEVYQSLAASIQLRFAVSVEAAVIPGSGWPERLKIRAARKDGSELAPTEHAQIRGYVLGYLDGGW